MTNIVPTVGRIVLFKVADYQAEQINRRRRDAADKMDWHRALKSGAQVHAGNPATVGDVYPAIITAVWGDKPDSAVNLKVLLDGTDDFWVTSVCVGELPGTYHWMPYQKAVASGEITPTLHAQPQDFSDVRAG